jgi:hypothetical protein
MLRKINYTIPLEILQDAQKLIPEIDFRSTLNQPTGRFFYDPWKIKEEFKGTIWEKIIDTIPNPIGEARLIVLKHGTCYHSHSDIDDRYHINIVGQYSFLINLDKEEMYKTETDGQWYEMDASPRHSASNFGNIDRIQLVIRKLLIDNDLENPCPIKIVTTETNLGKARYVFDNTISSWLNIANKKKIISKFNYKEDEVSFEIEKKFISELNDLLPENFQIIKL